MGKPIKQLQDELLARDGDRCHYCSLTTDRDLPHDHPRKMTIDHKTPLTRGGTWALDNLVIACGRCNGEKADMPFDVYIDFRRKLLRGGDRDALLAAIRALDAPTVTRIR
jgi:5-methylcytosine-specific restriction endonuclease McrA